MTFFPSAPGHIRLMVMAGMLWSLSILAVPCAASIGALRVASGLSRPVYATSPWGDTERLFNRRPIKRFGPAVQKVALRKLRMLDAATTLQDL